MTDLEKRIDEIKLDERIEAVLRSFNIDRSDIKELWSTGRFGTIAVPADRYKQYYDTIKQLQAQMVERDILLEEAIANAESVILEGSKHFCTEDERLFIIDARAALNQTSEEK